MDTTTPKTLYDEQKRGAQAPVYTVPEDQYRTRILDGLQMSYKIRELSHMELDDKTYSEYYLINRQQDFAYNPPKRNIADVRLNSGIIHEKDSTIQSIITAMNFQPKVRVFDKDDTDLQDASVVMTARLKKGLIKDDFKEKLSDFIRINISQGNVFIDNQKITKYITKKIPLNETPDVTKRKWKTIVEPQTQGCTSLALPNTGVFLSNILERDLHKQPRIWVVLHIPTITAAQMFKDFPRWKNVPKTPNQTVPVNIDGIWGDYFLQQPINDYMEVIMTQSEAENDYNIFLNGVMMYQVQEENGIVTGYPLSEVSASGQYTVVMGTNEPIPFFAYGRSEPSKNEVKEETLNEMMRLMFYKARQAAKPPVGNNTDRILPSNLWDAGVITPDISKDDLSILTPNQGITTADFNFVDFIQTSISDSTVSSSVEGTNDTKDITATQYVDQKKENLKKIALLLDQTQAFLKQVYWVRLFDEISYIDQKVGQYDEKTGSFTESYPSFSIDDTIEGRKGKTHVNLTDDTSPYNPYKMFQEEELSPNPVRKFNVRPDYLKGIAKNLRDKIYIEVVSEPEGEALSLLGVLFNLLTQYQNLKGGDMSAVNFEYIEKLIDQNSGFDPDKLFLKNKPSPNQMDPMAAMGGPAMPPGQGGAIAPMQPPQAKPPQNKILSSAV